MYSHSHVYFCMFLHKSSIVFKVFFSFFFFFSGVQVLYDLISCLQRSSSGPYIFPLIASPSETPEFEDTSRRGLMLVHLDSAVQHIEAPNFQRTSPNITKVLDLYIDLSCDLQIDQI